MFILSVQGAPASTVSAIPSPTILVAQPSATLSQEQVRHLVLGTPPGVQHTIRLLHQLGYAEVNDWSRLLATGRPDEVMAILTKRVSVE